MKTSSLTAILAAGVIAIAVAMLLVVSPMSVPADVEDPLTLVPLLMQEPDQIAKKIVEATGDEIVTLRLNDTDSLKVIAYTTTKGDIILPANGLEDEGYSRIEYWLSKPFARPLSDSDAVGNGSAIWKTSAMNFTKTFLEKIGYSLDGSEHFIAEPGGISTITIYQTVSGCEGSLQTFGPVRDTCIIANQPTRLHFKHDGGWMELRKWYQDVHQKEIKITEEEAKNSAKNYLENERRQTPETFQTYGNLTFNDLSPITLKQTYKDNLVYAVTVGYLTDMEYHCAPYLNFDVFVSVDDGKVSGWQTSACY